MSKSTKATSVKAKLETQLGREVTDKEVAEVEKALKQMTERMATVQAKHGKGSGRINRQTGKLEELDIVEGSMSFKENASGIGGKWGVNIRCVDCGDERFVATSDLHQVARCEEHQKEHKSALRKAKRKATKVVDPSLLKALS